MIELTRRRLALLFGATIGAALARFRSASAAGAATVTDEAALQVPAQSIPIPTLISPQAQGYLAAAAKRINAALKAGPAAQEAPRDQNAATAAALAFLRPMASSFKGSSETIELPLGAKLYRSTPEGRTGRRAKVAYLDIHGGGFTSGGGEMCQILGKSNAINYGVEVFSVDYRLAPEHAYPKGLDDCMAAYREVLKHFRPADVVVGGGSAGGNLAAALVLRARDEGLPLPAALVLMTPFVDFTAGGDSRHTNRFLDPLLYGGDGSGPSGYAGGADLKNPYLSPVFGDLKKGWPPTILTSGTRDLLLSDTVCMHRALRRAGVRAELHIAEAAGHGGFLGAHAPEDDEIVAECRRFSYAAWGIPA
jgi:acetyl esterase/lipase